MLTFNIRDAQKQLSHLVERVAQGEAFIISKAGKPMVKVIPLEPAKTSVAGRLGFMDGEFSVPDYFDQMGGGEIESLFTGRKA